MENFVKTANGKYLNVRYISNIEIEGSRNMDGHYRVMLTVKGVRSSSLDFISGEFNDVYEELDSISHKVADAFEDYHNLKYPL